MIEKLEQLYNTLEDNNFKGWDVFDGLNSTLFQKLPLSKSKKSRLIWIQLFKRSPINLRKLVSVPKGYNAKGLALFIQGLLNLYKVLGEKKYLEEAYRLAEIIIDQKAENRDYFCVGYNFYWEARAFSVPKFTPNIIVSSFVAQSFLDLFQLDNNKKWLKSAEDIGFFIETELKIFETDDSICFGYIPNEEVKVHNANLMGARLFARLYALTKKEKYQEYSVKSVTYSIKAQREDGAWVYGENDYHQWIDNFHTGFNLVSIREVQNNLGVDWWNENLEIGLKYHMNNHFLQDMTPKYFNNKLYPIDIHNFAQGILTLLDFGLEKNVELLVNKAIKIMWDERENFFYYQKNRYYTNKINYIRWSQAWMFYALSKYYFSKEYENK